MEAEASESEFVHLFAAAHDAVHEPQVFRMRWDQPLRRFAQAYASFRQLPPEVVEPSGSLRMKTASHGELDMAATAKAYGFTDGEQVVFSDIAAAGGCAVSSRSSATAGMQDAACTEVGRTAAEQHSDSDEAPLVRRKEAKRCQAAPVQADRLSDGGSRGCGRCFRCPVASCKVTQAREVGFRLQKCLLRHVREAHPRAKAIIGKLAAACEGRQTAAAKARPPATPFSGGRRGITAGAKQVADVDQSDDEPLDVLKKQMLSETVKTGAAKGWQVSAWRGGTQAETEECAKPAASRFTSWRLMSPGRSRSFHAFTTGKKPRLKDEVAAAVYDQLYKVVRPRLMKRLNKPAVSASKSPSGRPAKRKAAVTAEDNAEPSPKALKAKAKATPKFVAKAAASMLPPPVPPPKSGAKGRGGKKGGNMAAAPPAPVAAPPAAAAAQVIVQSAMDEDTQIFAPQAAADVVASEPSEWACGCKAHLRRHPHCVPSDTAQPELVHLRDYTMVGRGDTCDLLLDSRRTPQMISRCHGVIHLEEGNFVIIDQGSLNGMLVNEQPVKGKQALVHGDVITFGVPQAQPEFDFIFEAKAHQEDSLATQPWMH
eukprot:TRINITY_DN37670_c0_g3_i1.p1 TRINITY_DN37670_c0_g3~~TRINITY_DN37670_c0_g3_i1.p1  ORF type:complete len:597 (-),score=139.01 TRINITY_DN37670_c0_g3_i1:96-1886(-)